MKHGIMSLRASRLWAVLRLLFLLALVVASLFAPVYLGLAGGGKTAIEFADKTWAGLGRTPPCRRSGRSSASRPRRPTT